MAASICQGRPLGTDFSNVYAAGTYVFDGDTDAAFDPPQQFAREQAIFGDATQFYGWHYPPYFLFIAAPLALLPYGLALAVWQAVTLALYLLMIRGIVSSPSPRARGEGRDEGASPPGSDSKGSESLRGPLTLASLDLSPHAGRGDQFMWLLLALAFPAVLINIGHGQNGFLTAALLGGALVVLDRRPLVAGVLFGLLVYKPQYGLMLPLVLAVSGRWRCFAAAAATVVLLTLATTLTFGTSVWRAFLDSTHFTRTVVLEAGQYRLVQDPERLCLGAHVGRADPARLCAAGRVTVTLAMALVGCGAARRLIPPKRRRSASPPSSPRPTASITT